MTQFFQAMRGGQDRHRVLAGAVSVRSLWQISAMTASKYFASKSYVRPRTNASVSS